MSGRVDNSKREDHYGDGRQPWDDIVEQRWWISFAAGNVLKYIRRDKGDPLGDAKKARWYLDQLLNLKISDYDIIDRAAALRKLTSLLSEDDARRIREAGE